MWMAGGIAGLLTVGLAPAAPALAETPAGPAKPAATAPVQTNPRGTAAKIDDELWARIKGRSWHAGRGCPARSKLRVLAIPYIDFAGNTQDGRMIVAAAVSEDVLDVFAKLFRAGFAVARMRLMHTFDGDDRKSMRDNNTSAFNCRAKSSGGRLSSHAYGRAIDINPVQNPYLRKGRVLPAAGSAYARPSVRRRGGVGVIRNGGVVVRAFRGIGWHWGGNWRSVKDYQHFSQSGK